MNIKEVLALKPDTKVKDKEFNDIYIVIGYEGVKVLVDKSGKNITDLYTLQSILDMEFEEYDERPRYNFYDVLHLNQESQLGVKVIIKEAILNCDYTADIKKYVDEIDKPLSINRALTILADIFYNIALTDVLLNNNNFMIEENK